MSRHLAQYVLGVVAKLLDTRSGIPDDELPGMISRLETAISDDCATRSRTTVARHISGLTSKKHLDVLVPMFLVTFSR